MRKRAVASVLVCVGVGFINAQAPAPTLGQLLEGSSTVTGKAAPGTTPISIYDISYPTKTRIGLATTLSNDGSFSVHVRPALVKGHRVVATTESGVTSAPVTVVAANPN